MDKRQQRAREGEQLAAQYLVERGFEILAMNYRYRRGEIDIIAKHTGVIVFVEVKARQSDRFGDPKWAVTYKKQRKISMAALQYLKDTEQGNTRARFDVISINSSGDKPVIELVKNAFELAYE